jgi:hypothetical protein
LQSGQSDWCFAGRLEIGPAPLHLLEAARRFEQTTARQKVLETKSELPEILIECSLGNSFCWKFRDCDNHASPA